MSELIAAVVMLILVVPAVFLAVLWLLLPWIIYSKLKRIIELLEKKDR